MRSFSSWSSCFLSLVALVACGSFVEACSSSSSSPTVVADTGPSLLSDAGACGVTTRNYSVETGNHVPIGSTIAYPTNPPYGGPHYPIWAIWGIHQKALPAGHWVHNLEHGGVVFLYRCASRAACPDLAAQVEAVAKALPTDPLCTAAGAGVSARVLVLPDPDLPEGVQVAAAAWGWNLVSRCLDAESLRNFYLAHYGHSYEDTCYQGEIGEAPPDLDAGSDGGSDASEVGSDGGTDGGSDAADARDGG